MEISPERQKKEKIVETISERLNLSNSLCIFNYKEFKSSEFASLRTKFKENGAEVKVFKNTLFLKTLESRNDNNINKFSDVLKGQNAFLFSYQEPLLPIKTFLTFCEENRKPFLPIISLIENAVITDKNNLKKLANFEIKDNMYSYVGFILKLPLIKLLLTLKQITLAKDEKSDK
ncbi:50S ribosomal protein L10 [Mycoplasma sp. SG1]|uniref:50S ribosomal protein L10 n=1 Tax=Mycoplasma sp. SG1 TaxID=2810348 RepID=UPI00202515F5|nr:50S ribosomal protein L10 [Mycoplasma sp. SG1]URM52881.1 50S ribosomal protein L10 [Mycoplasma sp. SG1]